MAIIDTDTSVTADEKLAAIETKLQVLVASHERLLQENQFLRQRVSKLTTTRAKLLDKNRQASHLVKRVIGQLREEIA